MAVLNSLRETPDALFRNPVILLPILIIVALQLPQMILQSVNPLISSLVSFVVSLLMIVIVPFFQGGMIGMSSETLDGQTSIDTFLEEGKSNYLSILVAYLLLFGFNLVLGAFVVIPAVVIGAVLLGGVPLGRIGFVVLAVVGIIAVIAVLVYLVIMFFLQFYGHAIVLDDLGAIDGLKRSVSRVRHNLKSTLGYTILVLVLGGIVGLILGAGSTLTSPQTATLLNLPEPSLLVIIVISLILTVLMTVFGGFFAVYSVAFYRKLTLPETQ